MMLVKSTNIYYMTTSMNILLNNTTVNLLKQKAIFACTFILMAVCGQAHAETIEDGRFWFSISGQGNLPIENWHWNLDLQPRIRDEGQHIDQLHVIPAIYYQINPKSSIWLAYDHINAHPAGKESYVENIYWQQFSYKFDPIADLTFSSRSRLEERDSDLGSETGYRFRQMLRASYPLSQTVSLVASDELFLNLNQTDWGPKRGIDQNRAFVGLNWVASQLTTVEMGYMNQFINTRTINKENHILFTSLKFNF
jgi:hypothetical protein